MGDPIRIEPTAFYTARALNLLGLADGSMARARKTGELRYTRRAGRVMYQGQWVLDWLTAEQAGCAAQASQRGGTA